VVLDFEKDSTIRLRISVEVDEKKVETDEISFLRWRTIKEYFEEYMVTVLFIFLSSSCKAIPSPLFYKARYIIRNGCVPRVSIYMVNH